MAANVCGGGRVHLPEPGRGHREVAAQDAVAQLRRAVDQPDDVRRATALPVRPAPRIPPAGPVVQHRTPGLAGRADRDLDTQQAGSGTAQLVGVPDARHAQRAVPQQFDLVRPVSAQPEPAVVVRGVQRPGSPAEQPAGQRLDLDRHLHPGQPAQLLAHDGCLERALRAARGVLPVAAPAPAGARVRARRLDPLR